MVTLSQTDELNSPIGMDEQLKAFGRNLEREMELREMKPPTLSEKADVAIKTINNVQRGRHATQLNNLVKIADALGVEFWMMWLPNLPQSVKSDRLIQSLIEVASELTEPALQRIVRMAELELNAERAQRKNPKIDTPVKRTVNE